ncbi:hypothetical protein BC829DRAFT_477411 [Chytridium lagenaria]|nr:hypothetical protein BC829DRAFT_477411 [Chytridium lagenaria]
MYRPLGLQDDEKDGVQRKRHPNRLRRNVGERLSRMRFDVMTTRDEEVEGMEEPRGRTMTREGNTKLKVEMPKDGVLRWIKMVDEATQTVQGRDGTAVAAVQVPEKTIERKAMIRVASKTVSKQDVSVDATIATALEPTIEPPQKKVPLPPPVSYTIPFRKESVREVVERVAIERLKAKEAESRQGDAEKGEGLWREIERVEGLGGWRGRDGEGRQSERGDEDVGISEILERMERRGKGGDFGLREKVRRGVEGRQSERVQSELSEILERMERCGKDEDVGLKSEEKGNGVSRHTGVSEYGLGDERNVGGVCVMTSGMGRVLGWSEGGGVFDERVAGVVERMVGGGLGFVAGGGTEGEGGGGVEGRRGGRDGRGDRGDRGGQGVRDEMGRRDGREEIKRMDDGRTLNEKLDAQMERVERLRRREDEDVEMKMFGRGPAVLRGGTEVGTVPAVVVRLEEDVTRVEDVGEVDERLLGVGMRSRARKGTERTVSTEMSITTPSFGNLSVSDGEEEREVGRGSVSRIPQPVLGRSGGPLERFREEARRELEERIVELREGGGREYEVEWDVRMQRGEEFARGGDETNDLERSESLRWRGDGRAPRGVDITRGGVDVTLSSRSESPQMAAQGTTRHSVPTRYGSEGIPRVKSSLGLTSAVAKAKNEALKVREMFYARRAGSDGSGKSSRGDGKMSASEILN